MEGGFVMKKCNIYKAILIGAAVFNTVMPEARAAQQNVAPMKQVVVSGDTIAWGMPLNGLRLRHNEDNMNIALEMYLTGYRMKGDKATIFTPMLVNGRDTLDLQDIGLYSRIRYIQYLRNGHDGISGPQELSYQYSGRPEKIKIDKTVPYQDWMNGATLYIERCDYGCCHTLLNREFIPVAKWYEAGFTPVFHYVTPAVEIEKVRVLKGRAYIDFPVNMTDLYPDYRNNPRELQTIIATIDSVRNDKDVNIREITIKGYASPESPWENNTRLAKGRTATLKKYVENLYNFDRNLIKTDYWPEDWDGLREFVEKSGLEHKSEILAIIDDTTLEPDPKEAKIKRLYPDEYDFLLKTVYPALRHSDYTIEFTIRLFSDPAEIRKIMAETPQKLSLNEFFVLAQTLDPGSEEYNNIFETAVRMYPNSDVANLNAANSAMQRGDLSAAEKYLEKAGTSDAAQYARGILSALNGNYEQALDIFNTISASMPQAAQAAQEIQEILDLQ